MVVDVFFVELKCCFVGVYTMFIEREKKVEKNGKVKKEIATSNVFLLHYTVCCIVFGT